MLLTRIRVERARTCLLQRLCGTDELVHGLNDMYQTKLRTASNGNAMVGIRFNVCRLLVTVCTAAPHTEPMFPTSLYSPT